MFCVLRMVDEEKQTLPHDAAIALIAQYGKFPLLFRGMLPIHIHPLRDALREAHALPAQQFSGHGVVLARGFQVAQRIVKQPVGPHCFKDDLRDDQISVFLGILNRQQGIFYGPLLFFVANPFQQALHEFRGQIIPVEVSLPPGRAEKGFLRIGMVDAERFCRLS